MNKKILISLILIVLIIVIAVVFWFVYEEKPKSTLTLYGNVDVRQVDIGFRVSGRLQEMFFEEGDLVPKGALLATLEDQPYKDQLLQSKASMESTKRSLEYANQVLNRRKDLIGDGGVSEENLQEALSTRDVTATNLQQLEAAYGVAKTNYEDTKAYSPSVGTILTRIREPGSIVEPGQPVYTLSLLTPVWAIAYVSEPQLGLIYPGMKAKIFTDTPGSKIYEGQIGFISPVAEFTPKTVQTTDLRTSLVYRLRVIVDNADYLLKQGMPVTVTLDLDQKK